MWLESRTQGRECVIRSREQRPLWDISISHTDLELYNDPAPMDYLKTHPPMYSSGQCCLPGYTTCQALHASNFCFTFSLSSKPTLELPSPESLIISSSRHSSPHGESVTLRALPPPASLLLGLGRSTAETGSFMTAGAVSYSFPCPSCLGKYLLMNCVQHSAQNRVLVRRSVGQTS